MPTNKIIKQSDDLGIGYGPGFAGIKVDTETGDLCWNPDGTIRSVASVPVASNTTNAGTNAINFSGITPGTETAGSCLTTGGAWLVHTAAGACAAKLLCSSSAATGDYATMRIRGRADAVSTGGVEGINVSASANITNYTNLCAGYFAVQPNAITSNAASGIATAIHAVIDRTGASSGRTWVGWLDTHQETKSSAGDYLLRMSHNGTVANDGAITIYTGGRMPYLFNFEDSAGFMSASDVAIKVKTVAGDKFIRLYDTAS